MTIEKIDPQTIPERVNDSRYPRRNKHQTAEGVAVRKLADGEAVRIKCKWNHYSPKVDKRVKNPSAEHAKQCAGTSFARITAKRYGFKVKATCVDGYLYVHRGERYLESPRDENSKITNKRLRNLIRNIRRKKMGKEFNFKFSVKLQWPFTSKKDKEEDKPGISEVPETPVSSAPVEVTISPTGVEVTTDQQIEIEAELRGRPHIEWKDGVRLTRKSNYTVPDKRYRQYWESLEELREQYTNPLVPAPEPPLKYPLKYQVDTPESQPDSQNSDEANQKGTNYYRTIELKHSGLTQRQIAQELNISQVRVHQLWSDYKKSSSKHKAHPAYSRQKKKRTSYDKEFIMEVVTEALNTPESQVIHRGMASAGRAKVRELYNVPDSTVRDWIKRYGPEVNNNGS